jgi:hypothetical protein
VDRPNCGDRGFNSKALVEHPAKRKVIGRGAFSSAQAHPKGLSARDLQVGIALSTETRRRWFAGIHVISGWHHLLSFAGAVCDTKKRTQDRSASARAIEQPS